MISLNFKRESDSNQFLAELVRRIRSTNKLTQASFGKLFQPPVTQSTIARWEKGEQIPDKVHLSTIASFLDLSTDELLTLLDNPINDADSLKIEKKTLTPNKKHLKILKQGVIVWNQWREENPDVIPELAGVKLNDIELEGINLRNADLRGSDLSNVHFHFSNFMYADLSQATLNNVIFSYACLSEANFSKAFLREVFCLDAVLSFANLQDANLHDVNLNSADLHEAKLDRANLSKVRLIGANLIDASLEKASISDSQVFGASFLGTNVNQIKLDNVRISPIERTVSTDESIPIKDLALAQITYLQRYHPSLIRKFMENCRLEEEAIKLANILVDKYGTYSHKYDIQIYSNIQETYKPPYYEVKKDDNYLHVEVIPDHQYKKLVLLGKVNQRIILRIDAGITESNVSSYDLESLRLLVYLESKRQKERVSILAPIAIQIFESRKNNKFVCKEYILEKIDKEVILYDNSESKRELMRTNFYENEWHIVNSSLSENDIEYFQNLQITLQE
ncbi:MAG: pentapeptide repeat-containing protein [Xenococcaceae cyanobacterium]